MRLLRYSVSIVILLLSVSSAHGVTVLQTCTADGSGSSASCTLPNPVTAGSTLIVTCWRYNASACNITDTFGLTFVEPANCNISNGGPSFNIMGSAYVNVGSNSGSETVTGNNVITSTIVVTEVSGLANVVADGFACAGVDFPNGAAGTISSGNMTTTLAGDFIYAMAISSGGSVLSIGSGFTSSVSATYSFGGPPAPLLSEYKIAGAAGTYAGTESINVANMGWMVSALAFKSSTTAAPRHKPQVIKAPREVKRRLVKI